MNPGGNMAPAPSTDLLQSLLTLAWVVEARDPYTGGHLWRVSQFSMLLARRMGLGTEETARIGLAGFLHDLGKVAVPDAILNKPGKLTDEEYAVIKTHPRVGAELLGPHPFRALVEAGIALHHETPDGKGYPNGFARDRIPMDARIIGLTDAFDAMTSTRPYRKGMPVEKALAIVAECRGTQFDGDAAEGLAALHADGLLSPIIGHSEPHIPLQQCVECGPTIVVTRRNLDGEALYCRACGGGVRLRRAGNAITVEDEDAHAAPEQLAPAADGDLIRELIADQFRAALPPAA